MFLSGADNNLKVYVCIYTFSEEAAIQQDFLRT